MSARTFAPKLLFLLRVLCKYIRRYQTQIENFIGEDNITALETVIAACEAMEDILAALLPPVN